MITTEQRQILTELLGECWSVINSDRNRTFNNWQDFGAVVEKIHNREKNQFGYLGKEVPERFCILVADAIKEGVIK